MIKVRPNALKYSGIYLLLQGSLKDYLETLDKESLKDAFNALKLILLEVDLNYADRVLKEIMKHDSTSPEAILVTYKRLKENIAIYDDEICLPSDLPSYDVDTLEYDMFLREAAK